MLNDKVKRYYYLDILKFIAIVLVCMYHFNKDNNILYSQSMSLDTMWHRFLFGINSICIPIFFMVNGALLLNKKLSIKEYSKKFIWIIIQYFFWRTVTIIIISLYKGVNIFSSEYMNMSFFLGNSGKVDLNHLWFIPTLIGIYFIVPFIKKVYDDIENKESYNTIKYLLIALFMLCFISNFLDAIKLIIPPIKSIDFKLLSIFNPFVKLVGPMLFYFIIGGLLHKNIGKRRKVKNPILILMFLIGAIMLFLKWILFSMKTGTTYDNVYNGYATISTLMMAISIFLIISKLPQSRMENSKILSSFIKVIGNNTLSVYYFHWIFGYTLLKNIWSYIGKYGFFLNFIKALVIVIIFSYIGDLLKKIPFVKKLIH